MSLTFSKSVNFSPPFLHTIIENAAVIFVQCFFVFFPFWLFAGESGPVDSGSAVCSWSGPAGRVGAVLPLRAHLPRPPEPNQRLQTGKTQAWDLHHLQVHSKTLNTWFENRENLELGFFTIQDKVTCPSFLDCVHYSFAHIPAECEQYSSICI